MVISFPQLFVQWLPNNDRYYSHLKYLRNIKMRKKYLYDEEECPVIYALRCCKRNVLLIFLPTWFKTNLEPLVIVSWSCSDHLRSLRRIHSPSCSPGKPKEETCHLSLGPRKSTHTQLKSCYSCDNFQTPIWRLQASLQTLLSTSLREALIPIHLLHSISQAS